MSWQPTRLRPWYSTEEVPSRVRVTLADSTRVVLVDTQLLPDSLKGVEERGGPRTIPLSEVSALEARRVKPAALIVPMGAVLTALIVYNASIHGVLD